jgi:succinate dehydrogenase / fumarate reductase iron-sulfur subunit
MIMSGTHSHAININLLVWRQASPDKPGKFETYKANDISTEMSFLEMLDLVNERLAKEGKDPIEFDSDCREGICGMCGCMINGKPHGPDRGVATCQTHMRSFKDGETIVVEPFRAKAFPLIKDLVVNRSALDRIISAGGYISVKTGPHADANATLIPKDTLEASMDAAACIGCGACVAACPNAAAALFTGAKITHFALLPQGQLERFRRVHRMVEQHDAEGFGSCTNIGECSAACPKEIQISSIARMRREFRESFC